jgi:hypothetical protein
MSSTSKMFVFTAWVALLACNDAVDLNAATSAAFISGHAALNSSCEPQTDHLIGNGMFDIAHNPSGGSSTQSEYCSNPYTMNLVVDSMSDDLILFDEAAVTLRDVETGDMIAFDALSKQLPNPYKVLASGRIARGAEEGVVPVAVIPSNYRDQFDAFVGRGISVEVRLSGVARSGGRVSTQAFRFPVMICKGCLTHCSSDFPEGSSDTDIYGDSCIDNAGADGRICVDPACNS